MTSIQERLLSDPSVSPLALVHLLNKKYQTTWLTDEMEALLYELRDDFVLPVTIVKEKIRALRVCNSSNAPWTRFEVFAPVAQAFNGNIPVFNAHVLLEPHELALALVVMHTVRVEEVEEEVGKYIAASLMMRGIHFAPIDVLKCANKYFQPFNASAEAMFELVKHTPIAEVEIHGEENDSHQAAMARAELEAFTEIRSKWEAQEKLAQ